MLTPIARTNGNLIVDVQVRRRLPAEVQQLITIARDLLGQA